MNACTQGRGASGNSQSTSAPSNSQGVSRSVLANTEIGALICVEGDTDALRSQQSSCSVYDRSERRALLREIQCSLDSEAIAPLPNIDHDAARSSGESESEVPGTQTEDWLMQARLRLAALRSAANKEAICPADDAEKVALSAGQGIPIIEPVRAPLSDQRSTEWDSEQIAEIVIENRNLISVSLGGRVFEALIDSGAMVSLAGTEVARLCKKKG